MSRAVSARSYRLLNLLFAALLLRCAEGDKRQPSSTTALQTTGSASNRSDTQSRDRITDQFVVGLVLRCVWRRALAECEGRRPHSSCVRPYSPSVQRSSSTANKQLSTQQTAQNRERASSTHQLVVCRHFVDWH